MRCFEHDKLQCNIYSNLRRRNCIKETQMHVLKFTLAICTIAGCWQPLSWTSLFKHIMYNAHRVLLIFILCTFNVTQILNIVLNVDNSDEFTATIYIMLTVSVAFYKIISMWANRKNVTGIVHTLMEKPFVPSGLHEIIIRQRYDKMVQNTALWYLNLVMTTVACIILTSILTDFMNGNLTYRAWLPFNYTAPGIFSLVYVHQLMGMAICATVNVACDSLVCGLLLYICCQLELLEYRLTKISSDRDVVPDCVRHHDLIFEYARTVNGQFVKIIALQFGVSMLVVCSNLYQLAMAPISASVLPLILYTACMLAQIFIYCWFGNEVKLKSLHLADSIYNIEWLSLDDGGKKGLLLIMRRSMTPIEFTSAIIITLNLDSFVAVLKTSYSVFNLIRTQE